MRVGFVSETVSYLDYLFTVTKETVSITRDGEQVVLFPIIPDVYGEMVLPLSDTQQLMLCRRGQNEKGFFNIADFQIELLDVDPASNNVTHAEAIYYKDFFNEDRSQSE